MFEKFVCFLMVIKSLNIFFNEYDCTCFFSTINVLKRMSFVMPKISTNNLLVLFNSPKERVNLKEQNFYLSLNKLFMLGLKSESLLYYVSYFKLC